MSAAVMSNFYFAPIDQDHGPIADPYSRVQSWFGQMADYPPPPPPEQHHYSALYPTPAGSHHQHQLLDPQDQMQYSAINQPLYPKAEAAPTVHVGSTQQMHALANELQQHTTLTEQQHQHLAHAPQHIQHHSPHGTPPTIPQSLHAPRQQASPESSQKPNRLRKACDSCSIRKVKCDEAGPPCRACSALDIPCTFDRPSRRRGPPNRHAEAIKRRRLEGTDVASQFSGTSAPSSPTHAAQVLAGLPSQTSKSQLSAETICPIDLMDLLIDDFFTYIHPLYQFPHEPSFREAWKRREDLSNSSFLALLSAMMATLVASFPRKPRLHLKAQNREKLFPNHMSLVHRCEKVCAMSRGTGYLDSEGLNVYDAATSYYLGLSGFYTYRYRRGHLYLGECLTIVRCLGLHKGTQRHNSGQGATPASDGGDGNLPQAIDNITLEMSRRIFWQIFVTVKAMQQLGLASSELVFPPPTSTDPYPPFATEVDDFCIYPTHTEPQPAGIPSTMVAFNATIRTYLSYNSLVTMELAWGIDAVVDWQRQKRVLLEALRRCKDTIAELPPSLAIDALTISNGSNPRSGNAGMDYMQIPRDPAASLMESLHSSESPQDPAQRRRLQLEIQKAKLHTSSLATRSYLAEKYWNLCEAHERSKSPIPGSPSSGIAATKLDGLISRLPTSNPDMAEHEMRSERENTVRDLLVVLGTIDVVHMEPYADSFTTKIRAIAGTLLDAPEQGGGQFAHEAQSYLTEFMRILMRLQRVSPDNSESDQPEDDETELKRWADLREYQLKFAQEGGVLGLH